MTVPRYASEVVDTVATLKGRPGYTLEHFVSVRETGLSYRWVPGSTVTTNDREVIGHTGGTGGRWLPIAPLTGNAPEGAALGNADETISVFQGFRRTLPSSVTVTATRTFTVSTEGAELNAQLLINCLNTDPHPKQIVNGGPGGGTLATIPVGVAAWVELYFDGTDWIYLRSGEHL